MESRADLVYGLVQRLADRAADAERRERRAVPRLDDVVLPDQLRVMRDDLLAATADSSRSTDVPDAGTAAALRAATEDTNAVRRAL